MTIKATYQNSNKIRRFEAKLPTTINTKHTAEINHQIMQLI